MNGARKLKLPSIFKYLPEQYLEAFLKKGELLFRSLSYFQDYEDISRGDEFEGIRQYKPSSALPVTMQSGEAQLLPNAAFQSFANSDDIFVFCTSTELSNELAIEFNSNICVEITNVPKFVSCIRASLAIRPSIKNKKLLFGKVNYYNQQHPPIVDWALPEKITMSKLDSFQKQNEYRFAFAINDAFQVGETHHAIQFGDNTKHSKRFEYPQKILKIGNISKLCKIHRFD